MRGACIYMALLDLGMYDFEKIRKRVYDYYGCTIADCYNHPQYLKRVLVELYGSKANEIVKSIENYFGKEVEKGSVDDFLQALSEKESTKPAS